MINKEILLIVVFLGGYMLPLQHFLDHFVHTEANLQPHQKKGANKGSK